MKQMRFLGYLLVAVLCIGFTGCSDDDDNEGDYPNLIIGEWECIREQGWEMEDGEKREYDDKTSGDFTVFSENGTGYWYSIKTNGERVLGDNFNWTLKGDKLSIINPDETWVWPIVELNSISLVISYQYDNGAWTDTYRRIK